MSKGRQKWTPEEEGALLSGVERHGAGKWKDILKDPEFTLTLINRTNIDLKDKWRNISVNRERGRAPMLEGVPTIPIPPANSPQPLSVVPLIEYDGTAGPSRSKIDRRIAPDYEVLILEALSSIEDPNGADTNAILNFMEQNFELPENFERSVTSKLRRLVLTGELEKVGNRFKVKGVSFGAKTSQWENGGPSNDAKRDEEKEAPDSYDSHMGTETLEDAALYAAHAIARAENTEQEAIEACEEADRIAKLVEESMAMLKLAQDIHEICLRDGFVLLAP